MNDGERLHSAPADLVSCPQASSGHGRGPALVIEFRLEQRPRALNADDLTEAELRRCVDWIVSHDGGRMLLEEWLARHLRWRAA